MSQRVETEGKVNRGRKRKRMPEKEEEGKIMDSPSSLGGKSQKPCCFCGKFFSNAASLRGHIRNHAGERSVVAIRKGFAKAVGKIEMRSNSQSPTSSAKVKNNMVLRKRVTDDKVVVHRATSAGMKIKASLREDPSSGQVEDSVSSHRPVNGTASQRALLGNMDLVIKLHRVDESMDNSKNLPTPTTEGSKEEEWKGVTGKEDEGKGTTVEDEEGVSATEKEDELPSNSTAICNSLGSCSGGSDSSGKDKQALANIEMQGESQNKETEMVAPETPDLLNDDGINHGVELETGLQNEGGQNAELEDVTTGLDRPAGEENKDSGKQDELKSTGTVSYSIYYGSMKGYSGQNKTEMVLVDPDTGAITPFPPPPGAESAVRSEPDPIYSRYGIPPHPTNLYFMVNGKVGMQVLSLQDLQTLARSNRESHQPPKEVYNYPSKDEDCYIGTSEDESESDDEYESDSLEDSGEPQPSTSKSLIPVKPKKK